MLAVARWWPAISPRFLATSLCLNFAIYIYHSCRDRTILQRDVRVAEPFVACLKSHTSEVCGLRVSGVGKICTRVVAVSLRGLLRGFVRAVRGPTRLRPPPA